MDENRRCSLTPNGRPVGTRGHRARRSTVSPEYRVSFVVEATAARSTAYNQSTLLTLNIIIPEIWVIFENQRP